MFNNPPIVLPRLERMLAAAAAERIEQPAASSRRSRSRFSVPRIAAVALVATAFTGTAMAATGVWNPTVGGSNDPATLSSTPVPATLTAHLGVLRRDQTDQDRSPAVEATLDGGEAPDGVRLDSVRYLAPGANGEAVILLSGTKTASYFTEEEPLCVFRPSPGYPHAAGDCFDLSMLMSDHARAMQIDVASNTGTAYGVVPDGVSTVTAEFGSAPDETVPVVNNYWELPVSGPQLSNSGGGEGGVQHTVWRDADGNVVPQQPAG